MSERNYQSERQHERERADKELEEIKKFHDFLQSTVPDGVTVKRFKKMNADQAFTVIWFLQEVCHLLPDRYEMCFYCKEIYDSDAEGGHDDKKGRSYCNSCADEHECF